MINDYLIIFIEHVAYRKTRVIRTIELLDVYSYWNSKYGLTSSLFKRKISQFLDIFRARAIYNSGFIRSVSFNFGRRRRMGFLINSPNHRKSLPPPGEAAALFTSIVRHWPLSPRFGSRPNFNEKT